MEMQKPFADAKTAVFWDITSCNVPDGVDVRSIMSNITSALSKMNYCGPITFFAFGNTNSMTEKIVDEISSTGFLLQQVKGEGDEFHAFGAITVAMFDWAKRTRAPGNYVLISGNQDFSRALKLLRKYGYNILIGQPERETTGALTNHASAVWYSDDLLAGRDSLPFAPKWEIPGVIRRFKIGDGDGGSSSSS